MENCQVFLSKRLSFSLKIQEKWNIKDGTENRERKRDRKKEGKGKKRSKSFFLVLSKNAKFFIPLVSLVLGSGQT